MPLHRFSLATLLTSTLLAGCVLGLDDPEPDDDPGDPDIRACRDIHGQPIGMHEDRAVYDQDRIEVLVVELRVDDLAGWDAVNADQPGAEVPATLIAIDGGGTVQLAARVELRGQSSRLANQKSYKVHLEDGTWRGQRELNLNKHPFDLSRVRNQLAFELFRGIDHMGSLRTQFVQLMVNGEDYGLFTHIEEPDGDFLAAHGLDPEGTVYKGRRWELWPIDDATAADEAAMDELVDSKNNPDPIKLARMSRAINDWSRDINDVIDEHLDRDNYITWLAMNLLLGNFDTRDQNYILYSPSDCDTWYFLPWDYDGALGFYEQPRQLAAGLVRPRWRAGPANWWGTGLHERFLRDPGNLQDLRDRMDELRGGRLSDDEIATLLASYRGLVREQVSRSPDLWQLPVLRGTSEAADIVAQWDDEYQRIHGVVGDLDAEYREVIDRPMPVFLWEGDPVQGMHFEWSPSYDFQNDAIRYDFELASAADFADASIVDRQTGLADTWTTVADLPPGEYFWRVIIREAQQDSWQISFEQARPLAVE